MTYFVDFDRTLFDFDSFFPYLATLSGLESLKEQILEEDAFNKETGEKSPERATLARAINDLHSTGGFRFEPDSLAPFVYPDALAFLERHGRACVLVTSGTGDLSFQKGKVEASGVRGLITDVAYVPRDEPKGPVVASFLEAHDGPHLFIDDLAKQIDSVVETCPAVSGYEMRRDGQAGSGAYPVLRSFADLA